MAGAAVTPTLLTAASPSTTVGLQIFDNANLTGAVNPTGFITFNLFGPGDLSCTVPIFTSTVTVTGISVNSLHFTTTAAGTYRWTAAYNGDANNNPAGPTSCADPAEQVVVAKATPALSTIAAVPVGSAIHDTATLAGGFNPTGTITFTLADPSDMFCSGPPLSTSTATVNGNGVYNSATFVATVSGTYRWRASYAGDANNLPTSLTACLDPNESVTVAAVPTPTLTTTASGSVPLGGSVHDTATLAGGNNPIGSITFDLYGPNDATCAGTPAFSSTATVNGNGSYNSASFVPAAPGTYRWRATYSGDSNNNPAGPTACTDPAEAVVVTPPSTATLVTTASAAVLLGGAIHDTASLSGGTNPTGTITFNLYGPNDATCTSPSIFTATVTVSGNASYNSANFTPTAAGTYRWRASYSGDANNPAVGPTTCGDPAEAVTVTAPPPVTLTTTASGSVPQGGAVQDTATLFGGTNPMGTITFDLYGPNNATCTSPSIFTAAVSVNGTGTYSSPSFTAAAAGTYRWRATYSGDANNPAVGPTACNDPLEAVVVTPPPQPTLTTVASGPVLLGAAIKDTATLAGAANPTGTITFTLYGPNDATCAGVVIFTATVPVSGNAAYNSPNFTPTAPGTYRWRASYSGDANNNPAGPTACGDPNETVAVMVAVPTIVTNASASVVTGGVIHDTATLSGTASPTGTITFNLYGPNDATCATSIFTSTVAVTGNANYDSANFTATAPGTYRWRATYSGDANNAAVGPTACTDAAESVVVTPGGSNLSTTASPSATIGGAIHDTAALSGNANPTGTITFALYGPDDATCSAVAVFTSTTPVAGNGAYDSAAFVPTTPGAYRWRASYSGDANNGPAGPTACGDPNETVTVAAPASPQVATAASPSVPVGGVIHDTATLTGGGNPTGTITFTLFGPNDVTCTGVPIFTGTAPVSGAGTYNSPNFTPSAPGTYRWRARYSGDANNNPAGPTACTDPAEAVIITDVTPTITVTKTATPATMPPPGGQFTFGVSVTNTGPGQVILTALVDDVYGDLNNQGTCRTGIPLAPGATTTCTFPATFTGAGGQSQTDTVTATAVNSDNTPTTATADATVSITSAQPTITVDEATQFQSQPEPGGTFTFGITVTNTSDQPLTLKSLVDEDLNGQGTCRLPQTLAPNGGQYSCTFPIVFTGNAGDQRVVTVTATAVGAGGTATASDTLVLSLTNVPPVISATKTADPPTRRAPGGTFTFAVTVTNSGAEPVVLTALSDDRYGDLDGMGSCATGVLIAANGGTYGCSFTATFTGRAGDSQTDNVTATAVDDDASLASTKAAATVTLTAPTGPGTTGGHGHTVGVVGGATPSRVASVAPVAAGTLAHTGAGVGGRTRLAVASILAGLLLVAAAWKRKPPAARRRS